MNPFFEFVGFGVLIESLKGEVHGSSWGTAVAVPGCRASQLSRLASGYRTCLPTETHSGPRLFARHHFNVEGDIARCSATSLGVNNRFKIYSSALLVRPT